MLFRLLYIILRNFVANLKLTSLFQMSTPIPRTWLALLISTLYANGGSLFFFIFTLVSRYLEPSSFSSALDV